MSSGVGKYTVTVDPASDPVTLAEAKLWLRIDSDLTADDTLITALISAATETCEKYTGRLFVQRTIKFEFSNLYGSTFEYYPYNDILRSPFGSLSTATVVNDGSPVDISSYVEVSSGSGYPRILFYDTTTTPDTEVALPFALTFTAGYGAAADVPETIKTAIKEQVNFLYENRGDVEPGNIDMPPVVKALLSKYRINHCFG